MKALVWGIEWRLLVADRRGTALFLLAPLALAVVIATDGMPAGMATATYATLIVLYGMARTALCSLREEARGMTLRVLRGGVSPAGFLLQRALAGGTLTFVSVLPAVLVVAGLMDAAPLAVLTLLAALVESVVITALAAVIAAALSRNATEMLILCGAVGLVSLHMSGVFRSPYGGAGIVLESISPFRFLHEAFVGLESGEAPQGYYPATAWLVGLVVVVGLKAPSLTAYAVRRR